MKKIYLITCLAFSLLCSSCCQNINTTCTTGNMNVIVTGFMESDLSVSPTSSIPPYAIRYQQDNAFDKPMDTFMISSFKQGTDTFMLLFHNARLPAGQMDSLENGLLPHYDYKIVFPADTLTYTITNIQISGATQVQQQKCPDKAPPHCYKNPTSCNVNGISRTTLPTLPPNNTTANYYTFPVSYIILVK
jgi:hypothetical protein